MTGTRAASRYAKAIFEIASSKGQAEIVGKDMLSIAELIQSNAELKEFILNPTVSVESKNAALLKIFVDANEITKSLFRLLFENKRFEILEQISNGYNNIFQEANNIQTAYVTTAFEITPEVEKQVLAKIATISNKKIVIKNIIDPSILGGFVLRIGDQQFNASVSSNLRKLSRELSN